MGSYGIIIGQEAPMTALDAAKLVMAATIIRHHRWPPRDLISAGTARLPIDTATTSPLYASCKDVISGSRCVMLRIVSYRAWQDTHRIGCDSSLESTRLGRRVTYPPGCWSLKIFVNAEYRFRRLAVVRWGFQHRTPKQFLWWYQIHFVPGHFSVPCRGNKERNLPQNFPPVLEV